VVVEGLEGRVLRPAGAWLLERTCERTHAVAQEAKLERSDPTPVLSIILPCHNEAARLPPTLQRYLAHFPRDAAAVELIVVDIGSTDHTAMVAERLAEGEPRLRVLQTPSHGKGFGVRAGMLAAQGRLVAFTDGDGSYGPEQLEQIVEALQEAPVAIGVRSAGTAKTLPRTLASSVFNSVVRLALRLPCHDTQCGLKGFHREAARELFGKARVNGFAFDVEVLLLAQRFGYRVVEVPMRAAEREGSKIRLRVDALRMLKDVWSVRRAVDRDVYATHGAWGRVED
jgi:dolichyl-phosphate beta-glucosyltransferase